MVIILRHPAVDVLNRLTLHHRGEMFDRGGKARERQSAMYCLVAAGLLRR